MKMAMPVNHRVCQSQAGQRLEWAKEVEDSRVFIYIPCGVIGVGKKSLSFDSKVHRPVGRLPNQHFALIYQIRAYATF